MMGTESNNGRFLERPCPEAKGTLGKPIRAHGPHQYKWGLDQMWCPGLKAHPDTMIGKVSGGG